MKGLSLDALRRPRRGLGPGGMPARAPALPAAALIAPIARIAWIACLATAPTHPGDGT